MYEMEHMETHVRATSLREFEEWDIIIDETRLEYVFVNESV